MFLYFNNTAEGSDVCIREHDHQMPPEAQENV